MKVNKVILNEYKKIKLIYEKEKFMNKANIWQILEIIYVSLYINQYISIFKFNVYSCNKW